MGKQSSGDPGQPAATSWHRLSSLLPPALIFVAAILSYCNTFAVPFVFDDESSIVNNPVIKDLGAFLSGAGYAYNPRRIVGYLTFALNYRFGGLNVFGYHLVNLLIHVVNGLLVYALAGLAIKAASPVNGERGMVNISPSPSSAEDVPFTVHPSPFTQFIPLFAALLFVVHPVQTQAVTYIVQRLASLATLFYLAAVVAYAYGRHKAQGTGLKDDQKKLLPIPVTWSPIPWYLLAVISGLLAIKTKEMAVTLPLAIILYEFCLYGFNRKKLLVLLIPLALGVIVATVGIAGSGRPLGELLSDVSQMSRETENISRANYLVTQFAVVATYLRLLMLPVGQNLDYDYPVYTSLLQPKPLLGLMLHLALIGTALWAWRKAQGTGHRKEKLSSDVPMCLAPCALRLISFGILWFYLTLSVESGLIPIKDVIYEHRIYLASPGFFLAVAATFHAAWGRMPARTLQAAAAVLVLVLAVVTFARNRVWHDPTILWSDVVAKSPAKGRPRVNLANCLEQAGRSDEALASYLEGVRLQPRVADSHNNLGAALFKRGNIQGAIEEYGRAIALRPKYVRALNNMGIALVVSGRPAEALEYYRRSLAADGNNGETWYNLGVAFMEVGNRSGAQEALNRSLALAPDSANTHNTLGSLYGMTGAAELALKHHRRAVELDPKMHKAYMGLAIDCEAHGWLDEAERNYRQALRLNPAASDARTNLAILLVETGRKAEGIAELETVLALNPYDADARANLEMARRRASGKN